MGGLLSRFRKQQTTEEILESIDKDITKLQRFRRQNQEQQQRVVLRLVLGSILLSIIAAFIIYFVYLPNNWRDRILYICLPSIGYVFLILGLRKLLHWYFVKRLTNNDLALGELRERRKQILEDVMENETYKKAKSILEKFDPARFKQLERPAATPSPMLQKNTPTLRQRPVPGVRGTPSPRAPTPGTPRMWQPGSSSTPRPAGRGGMYTPRPAGRGGMYTPRGATPSQNGSFVQGYGPPPGPPLPRPILPRERTTMDAVMEFLVGDGPTNRYALICRNCHSHNGMALKEEFEYLTFRCCYCFSVNPARKQRPFAPKLEFPAPPSQQTTPQSTPLPQRAAPPGAGPRVNTEEDESDYDDEDDYDEDDEEEGDDEEDAVEQDKDGEARAALAKEKDEKKPAGQTTATAQASESAPLKGASATATRGSEGALVRAGATKLPVRRQEAAAPSSTGAARPPGPGSASVAPRPQTGVGDTGRKQELPRQPDVGGAPVKTVPLQTQEVVQQQAPTPAVVPSGKVVTLRKPSESGTGSSVDVPADQKSSAVEKSVSQLEAEKKDK